MQTGHNVHSSCAFNQDLRIPCCCERRMVFYLEAIFTTALLLGEYPEFEAGGVRWQQAEKNAARGGFLDRRGSPLAVLDPNKAENGVDARAGGGGREEEDEDEKNGGKWKLHADGF